jgi:hypothetical protein
MEEIYSIPFYEPIKPLYFWNISSSEKSIYIKYFMTVTSIDKFINTFILDNNLMIQFDIEKLDEIYCNSIFKNIYNSNYKIFIYDILTTNENYSKPIIKALSTYQFFVFLSHNHVILILANKNYSSSLSEYNSIAYIDILNLENRIIDDFGLNYCDCSIL